MYCNYLFYRNMSKLRTAICLFRNDLRLHDNEALISALKVSDCVVPLYCFDPNHYKSTWHFNLPKTGAHRAKFLIESAADLRSNLRKLNTDLVIHCSTPLDAIKNITAACNESGHAVSEVVFQKEVTYEEVKVEEEIENYCRTKNIKVSKIWGATLYHSHDLPFKSLGLLPDTYTSFRKEVENKSRVRKLVTLPDKLRPLPPGLDTGSLPDLASLGHPDYVPDSRSAFPFLGGETSALARLEHYLWSSDCVAKYKETRNGLIGQDYSTKFSPWLAAGCLSPRMIYWEIKRYEQKRVANNSTYWVIFELLWRDYFRFVCQKYGDRVFYQSGILNKQIPWSQDENKFRAWCEGRTGVPFVDANMRELRLSGWMSNRGRQNVASFLVKDLGLDWRLGAEWFESQLLDHDVCSNYGNWNYAAGVGNDPRENRKFNMIKQGLDYDKDGDFIRLWVDELSKVKGGKVHFPWTMSPDLLSKIGLELGVDYPKPIIIAPEWSKHTSRDAAGGGQQRGVDFYFKPSGQAGARPNHHQTNNNKNNKKKPLKGGRVQ